MNKALVRKFRSCWDDNGELVYGYSRPMKAVFVTPVDAVPPTLVVFERPDEKLRFPVYRTGMKWIANPEERTAALAGVQSEIVGALDVWAEDVDRASRDLRVHLDNADSTVDLEEASNAGSVTAFCRKCGADAGETEPDGNGDDCSECDSEGSVDSALIIAGLI